MEWKNLPLSPEARECLIAEMEAKFQALPPPPPAGLSVGPGAHGLDGGVGGEGERKTAPHRPMKAWGGGG